MFSPFRLIPVTKDYLWGGARLYNDFGKKSETEKTAESWELSCHKDGYSVVETDKDQSLTLKDLIDKYGTELIGSNCSKFTQFPVLIKLIDAADDLSLQVHPDDSYALKNEGEYGKTEMWYVIDCADDASIIYGFDRELTREEFATHIENGTLIDAVKKVPVKKGDVFFIKAGTLHSIGKNMLIAEIQQNSNTTYRVYDYGRKDKNGALRELHIQKALDVTQLKPAPVQTASPIMEHGGFSSRFLGSCEFFNTSLLDVHTYAELFADKSSFEHLLVTEGNGCIKSHDFSMDIKKGDSIFIPAGYGSYTVSGRCLIIKTRID